MGRIKVWSRKKYNGTRKIGYGTQGTRSGKDPIVRKDPTRPKTKSARVLSTFLRPKPKKLISKEFRMVLAKQKSNPKLNSMSVRPMTIEFGKIQNKYLECFKNSENLTQNRFQ